MIGTAVSRSFISLLRPSILFIMVIPFFISSIIWLLVLFFTWGLWTELLMGTGAYQWMLSWLGEGFVMEGLGFLLVLLGTLLVFGPLWYLTYILLISTLLFPLLLPRVKKISYPNLESKKGGSFVGSVKNSLVATFVFLLGYLLALPLWLFTPLSPVVNLLLTAYLNKKIFTYDVLQDFASEEERKALQRRWNHEGWALGLLTAALAYVPIINFLAPPVTALSYIHYLLSRLQEMRQNPGAL